MSKRFRGKRNSNVKRGREKGREGRREHLGGERFDMLRHFKQFPLNHVKARAHARFARAGAQLLRQLT